MTHEEQTQKHQDFGNEGLTGLLGGSAAPTKESRPQRSTSSARNPKQNRTVTSTTVTASYQLAGGGILAAVLVAIALVWLLGTTGVVILAVVSLTTGGSLYWRYRQDQIRKRETEAKRQAEVAEAQRKADLRALHEDILALRNQRRRSTVIFVGNQGGGISKTITCAYLALTFRIRLKGVPVIIVECRRDSAEGVDKHGLDHEKTTTIRGFYNFFQEGAFHNELGHLDNELIMDKLILSKGGIYYLQADRKAPEPDTFGKDEAAEVIRILKRTGAVIIIDSGNSPTDPITIGMANESALGVFPTLPTSKSFEMRRRTIETFKEHLSSTIVDDYITVLNAVQPQHSLEKLMEQIGYVDDERFFFTLFDEAMKDEPVDTEDEHSNNGTKLANLVSILPENRLSYDLMVRSLLQMFVNQSGERIPVAPEYQQPKLTTH